MLRKLYRAWRFYIRLNYPWRLAWHKALHEKAPEKTLNDAMLKMKRHYFVVDPRWRAGTQRDQRRSDIRGR